LKKNQVEFFTKSFKLALIFGLIFSIFEVAEGDIHGADVAEKQPAKMAAMECHWETTTRAPIYLFAWPDEENERNSIQIGTIPGMLSFLAFKNIDAEVRGLKDFPKDERPPVLITSLAFKAMVGLGTYFCLVTIIGFFLRNRLTEYPLFLKLMIISIPLPYIAAAMGWIVTEVGRQPWIVYGLMKTSDGVSPIATSQVAISLMAFIIVYGALGAIGYYLMGSKAIKGPEDE